MRIGDDEEGGDDDFMMAEVGLFAMKRDQIARAILPLTVAGIEVDVVQMAPIALYNYITYDQIKGSGSKESVVVLDIGVDNTDLGATQTPGLTSIKTPIIEIGIAAADQLIARLEGREHEAFQLFPIEIVHRGSTGKPAA